MVSKNLIALLLGAAALVILSRRGPVGMTRLHTDGAVIRNKLGGPVHLRGSTFVEPSFMLDGVYQYWPSGDACFNLLKESGATCMRLAIAPWEWVDEGYKLNVDYFVNECAKRGIYVYIDLHSMGTYTGTEAWADFVDNKLVAYHDILQDIAERYRGSPGMMGIQIFNEPRGFYNQYPYEGYWWDFSLEAARKIHEIDPTLLVFVDSTIPLVNGEYLGNKYGALADAGYKMVGDQFALNPLPEPNIVYSFHAHYPYRDYTDWVPFVKAYNEGDNVAGAAGFAEYLYEVAGRVQPEYNLPVFNSEFNVKQFDFRDGRRLPYDAPVVLRDYLAIMNSLKMGWTHFPWKGAVGYAWDRSPESNQLVYMGDPNTQYWTTLSYQGEVWKDAL